MWTHGGAARHGVPDQQDQGRLRLLGRGASAAGLMPPAQVGNSQRALARGIQSIPLTLTAVVLNQAQGKLMMIARVSTMLRTRQWRFVSLPLVLAVFALVGMVYCGRRDCTWVSPAVNSPMAASVPSSPCWSTPRRSWGSATWWLAWISSIMTTRTSSATSSSLDSSLLLQGTSFNLLTQMLFVSSTPSELEQNLRDFPKLTDFCPNFSPSGQNLNFNLTNRLFNTLVSKQRIYGNIPQKWKKYKKNIKCKKWAL